MKITVNGVAAALVSGKSLSILERKFFSGRNQNDSVMIQVGRFYEKK